MRERLWVALDVETLKEADGLLERLGGAGPAETIGAKIGSQLFTAAGPAAVETALKRGFAVFLDLRYHDIPNTVAGAVREATRIGVAMLNVHAGGVTGNVEAHVLRLAERAREMGLDGCVASPQEIRLLRRALGPRWTIVAPGIRPAERSDDQKRVATAAAAIRA